MAPKIAILIVILSILIPVTVQANPQTPDDTNQPTIVGGTEAEPGAWPWMAALVTASEPEAYWGQFCGGALIRPQWVLTAAHCTENKTAADIHVVVGRHELSSAAGERIAVDQIINHPNYDTRTLDVDIALLHLETPSSQTPIGVVGAVEAALFSPGVLTTVTGWGLTSANGNDYPDALRQVSVPIVSNATCNQSYGGDITANMICAGYVHGGQDSCSGDSGGPMMVPAVSGNGWLQAGVVSWGQGCAEPGYYGVYTRVAEFKDWIISHAGEPQSMPKTFQVFIPLVIR
jgi:secreted trypsin-like serine protease